MALKRITQETFDEVVKENEEEFEMDRAEALAEAVKQFKSQGVSLENIDVTGGVGRAEVEAAMDGLVAGGQGVLEALSELSVLCDASHELGARNRTLMISYKSAAALNALHALVVPSQAADILIQAMKLLKTICKNSIEARDFFEPNGSQNLVGVMSSAEHGGDAAVIHAAFDLARVAAKSENNKFQLMKKGLGEIICKVLARESVDALIAALQSSQEAEGGADAAPATTEAANTLQHACLTMRGLCIHDDLRREMSCAMDNGKFFINASGFVPSLMRVASAFKVAPAAAGAALSAAKTLVTTEEAVQVMAQNGAMDLPKAILSYQHSASSLHRHLLGLTRNLCADDIRKDRLVADGTLELLVASLADQERSGDVVLVEHGLACLAAMSLRSPSNSNRIMASGAGEVVVNCLRRHADRAAVQRQGCLAFRNIAARCPQHRNALLDAGAEAVLRAAGRHQAAVDEAYGALRDLGCDVHKVRITEDGRVEPAYEQFGAPAGGKKLAFNPVYDDSINLVARVEEEAHAPFEGGQETIRPFSDDGHSHTHAHVHDENCGH